MTLRTSVRRKLEFEYIENGLSFSCFIEGDGKTLNRLFALIANHPAVMRAEQHEVGTGMLEIRTKIEGGGGWGDGGDHER